MALIAVVVTGSMSTVKFMRCDQKMEKIETAPQQVVFGVGYFIVMSIGSFLLGLFVASIVSKLLVFLTNPAEWGHNVFDSTRIFLFLFGYMVGNLIFIVYAHIRSNRMSSPIFLITVYVLAAPILVFITAVLFVR